MINEDIIKLKKFCCEDISLIENYNEAKKSPEQFVIHHRDEIQDNGTLLSRQQLKDLNMYYNLPASKLIFMPYGEHSRMHMKVTRKHIYNSVSDETKVKLSKAAKDNNLGINKTDEQLRKIWKKYRWLTPDGDVVEMYKQHTMRYHPDWIKIED